MNKNSECLPRKKVITIGRQTGAGGRYIGRKLADELSIPFYDRNLLERAAKESGYAEGLFENHDEVHSRSFLFSLAMGLNAGVFSADTHEMPLDNQIFLVQFNTIRKIADEGPCVILGRCADYALEGYCDKLSVFLRGDKEERLRHLAKYYPELSEKQLRDQMNKTDRQRNGYYNYYTDKEWGAAASYDMCLNTSVFGLDGCAALIRKAWEL